jgi:hypothetical protein
MMNDLSVSVRSITGQKAGSDLQDTGNEAGTYLDGRDDEAPCPRFRPLSSITIDERHTEAETTPIRKALGPSGEATDPRYGCPA